MARKYTDEEYAAILTKKQVGTAVLLFNTKGELLIVKPDYRDGWLVPGGATDDDESPLHCALRETKEEIGLDILEIIPLDSRIARRAALLRRLYRTKTLDSAIAATALSTFSKLVTRNARDFKNIPKLEIVHL